MCASSRLLSVRFLAYLKNHMSDLHKILVHVIPVAVARPSFSDNATCYLLPVLRMTPCFHIIVVYTDNDN